MVRKIILKPNKSSQASVATAEKNTHFGYTEVTEDKKTSMVRDVFSSVASHYDLMNDLMSVGIHRLWKMDLIRAISPVIGCNIVDVGGGTGDISLGILKKKKCQVTVCDINEKMVYAGRDKAINKGVLNAPEWICSDAAALPFRECYADVYVTAFCLRNVTRLEDVLIEARRILKPGGHFLCLEFSKVNLGLLDALYGLYSFQVLPFLGQIIAGDREAYQYLVESIRRFPNQETFSEMIFKAGLDQVSYRNLSGGIAAIHSAWRI